jgi:hypothetical protein
MKSNIKPFDFSEESMYDLDSYVGRIKHFAKVTDVRKIFLTNERVDLLKEFLNDFKNYPQKYDLSERDINKKLWDAKYSIKSAINSETGQIIPTPFRMSCLVPMNLPIAFGLLCLPVTKFNILLFNFWNQSYNSALNYANSSGTAESTKFVIISYILALTTSMGSGMWLKNKLARGSTNVGTIRELAIRFLPTFLASFLNIFFMRSDYILNGINVRDKFGEILGQSRICGMKAVLEGGVSRVVLPMPFIINFFILKNINKYPMKRTTLIATELSLCVLALSIGLPISIALFKEYSTMSTNLLEKEIKRKAKERDLDFVYYNKGL